VQPGVTAAYAIRGRKLSSIVDGDGLIDGDYLDSVSGSVSREFDALLKIDASHDAG
jgi:hypothetical protein